MSTRKVGLGVAIPPGPRVAEESYEREPRIRASLDQVSFGVAYLGSDGRWLHVNERLCDILGYVAEELLGRTLVDILHPDGPAVDTARVQENLAGDVRTCSFKRRCVRKDGSVVWLHLTFGLLGSGAKDRECFVCVVRDITERRWAGNGRSNRVPWRDDHEEAVLAQVEDRGAEPPDPQDGYFGTITLHMAGSRVAEGVAGNAPPEHPAPGAVESVLRAVVRPGDTVRRVGADGFAIILEGVVGVEDATRVARRIEESSQFLALPDETGVLGKPSIHIALDAVGEALAKDVAWTSEEIENTPAVEHRDHAAVYADDRVSVGLRREEEADLARALRRGELEVHYQPVVSLRSDRIIGVEALVRWKHPRRGLLLPLEFIPLAEKSDLIIPLGRWVLEQSCRQAREWQQRYPSLSNLEMCVNLSARQLRHRGLVGDVAEALQTSGLRGSHLVLEMTESIMMEDVEAAAETLRELKGLGVRLAIDDFGTGYSSLSYLRRFPVDVLKIDKSFVSDLGHELEDVTVVSAVIKLAKAMGLEVVAEGIEKTAQLTQVRGLDCEFAQGFLFARPLPHEAVSGLLARVGA